MAVRIMPETCKARSRYASSPSLAVLDRQHNEKTEDRLVNPTFRPLGSSTPRGVRYAEAVVQQLLT